MKRTLLFILIIVIIACFIGCSTNDSTQNTGNSNIVNEQSTTTTTKPAPYEYRYEENDHSTWGGYDIEKNYQQDMSEFVLDNKEFDFNKIEAEDLIGMGYGLTERYLEPNDCKMIIREFISQEGAELFCVLHPDGRIEYMQIQYIADILDPNDPDAFGRPLAQTQCKIFNGIYPGMSRDDFKKAINDESIRVPTKEQDAVCSVRIKNEQNTISVLLMHDYVETIIIVNNQLAKFQ